MTITEFRNTHQKGMHDTVWQAGLYLEANGLVFGHDFVTGDALDLAAAFLTRKHDERLEDEKLEAFSKRYERKPNRFETESWEERFA